MVANDDDDDDFSENPSFHRYIASLIFGYRSVYSIRNSKIKMRSNSEVKILQIYGNFFPVYFFLYSSKSSLSEVHVTISRHRKIEVMVLHIFGDP